MNRADTPDSPATQDGHQSGAMPDEKRRDVGADDFRRLADHIPTLCWMAEPDGYIYWYNRRWHEYCGSTPEQMAGWGWQSVHHPDHLPSVMNGWANCIENGEPFEMIFPLRGADGRYRPFLTRAQPTHDDAGAVSGWIGANMDISEQVELEDRLRAANVHAENAAAVRAVRDLMRGTEPKFVPSSIHLY